MYARRKPLEELPKEETLVWRCTSDGCKGWMRDQFSFEHVPECCLCGAPMHKSTMELPILNNHTTDVKKLKPGIKI